MSFDTSNFNTNFPLNTNGMFSNLSQFNFTPSAIQYSAFNQDFLANFQKTCSEWLSRFISQPAVFTPQTYNFSNFSNISSMPTINYSLANFVPTQSVFTTQSSTSKFETAIETKNEITSNDYSNLSQAEAIKKARNDSRLEYIGNGGRRWNVADTFYHDIKYAKKGTGVVLDKIAAAVGKNLTITSALGTGEAGSPHTATGYCSHYNSSNPKLDIQVPDNMSADDFANELMSTGYFSHVLAEGSHVDVQIAESAYKKFESVA